MKDIRCFILFLCTTFVSHAQNWEWAKAGNNAGQAKSYAIASYGGYLYTAGFFEGVLSLDTVTLTCNGKADAFVAKYDKTGSIMWARNIGGGNNDEARGIATDNAGNIIVTGTFNDTLVWGGDTAVSRGGGDIFIAKIDSAGNAVWLRSAGGAYGDEPGLGGNSLLIDDSGDIIFTGQFASNGVSPPIQASAWFDTIQAVSNGGGDVFLAKYNGRGSALWVKTAGGVFEDMGINIVKDNIGNLFMCGRFEEPYMYFDTVKLNSINQGFVVGNIFIAKYDSVGNFLWAHTAGGIHQGGVSDGNQVSFAKMVTDISGNSYVFGHFFGCKLIFDNSGIVLPNDLGDAYYIAKYTSTGNLLWAKVDNWYSSYVTSASIAFDKNEENIFITGGFNYIAHFAADTITALGDEDIFVAKYDKNGNELWMRTAGGNTYDVGYDLILDDNDNVFVCGHYTSSPADFNGNQLYNTGGSYEAFIAKLSPTLTLMPNEIFQEKEAVFYPNPNDGRFTINLRNKQYRLLSLVDVNGRVVYEQKISDGTDNKISIQTRLPAGVYFLKLHDRNGMIEVKKLIIEN